MKSTKSGKMDGAVLLLLVLGLAVDIKGQLNIPSCGRKPHSPSRIVGGTVAPDGAWPWHAMVLSRGKQYCGGTLVTNQWVVTAAHCLFNYSTSIPIPINVTDFSVRLGAQNRTVANPTVEQNIGISQYFMHPSYHTPLYLSNDIALLRLKRPAMLNQRVNLACLPSRHVNFTAGKYCWVSGWGKLAWQGVQPERLRQAKVPLRSESECYKAHPNWVQNATMICAGYTIGGVDTCQFDSGGPLVCEHLNRWYLTGVTSFGDECARPGKYGVYARVPNLTTWINHVIANN